MGLLGLRLLIWPVFRGWSFLLLAPAATLIAAAENPPLQASVT